MLVPWLILNVNILGVRAWIATNHFCWIRLHFNERKKRWREGWGGQLFEEAIMLNTSFWGVDYLRSEVINRGIAIIWGDRVFMVQNKSLITETKAHAHTRVSDLYVSNINMILNLSSVFKVLLASCYIPFYAGLKFPQFKGQVCGWYLIFNAYRYCT